MMNGQYIKMRVNGASTNHGPVSTIIHQCLGHCYAERTYWQLLLAIEVASQSLPHS